MFKPNEKTILFVLLLVFVTLLAEISAAFGSPASEHIAERPDPLRKFKQYGGDYDIMNKHYWTSAAFTGIHGYAVAGLWLLCGTGFGIFILVKNSWGRTSPIMAYQNSMYLIVFLLIILFTIFAIISSSVIIVTNKRSEQRAEELEKTIFDAGTDACQTIGKVKISLIQMQNFLRPYDPDTCKLLDLMTHRLRKESLLISSFVDKTRRLSYQAIQTLYVVNLVVVSVNLALLIGGLVLLGLQYRPGIVVLIVSCWILTTFTWILTGVDFFFYTFIGDTCSSLKNFEQNPQNSSLTNILPCPKSTFFDKTLVQIGQTVHSFIIEINLKISEYREVLAMNDSYENKEIQEVCDPFSRAPNYTYSPENCRNNSIPIGDIPSILSRFICFEVNSSKDCPADGRFLPESIYVMTLAYCQSTQALINIYPDLSRLLQCSSVKEAFSNIVLHQCKPIKLLTKVLWSSMLTLSIVMVILILIWTQKAIQDKGRSFNRWSIFPEPL